MLNSNINKALEINSNKAVLLSIKKQWLEKILSGEKTIEVRKTMPWEISYPFVVFCYETKANGGAGKVTAAFVCRDINTLDCLRELPAYAIGTEVTEKTAQFGQTAKPCRTRNFRIKSWISLRNGLTKPEKEAHQKLLHILANSIVLKLYDR